MMVVREEDVVESLVGNIGKSHGGRSLQDVVADINHSCQASTSRQTISSDASSGPFASLSTTTHPYPDRIWMLLTDHPQISVGFEKQFNRLALADLLDHNDAALARIYYVAQIDNQIQSQLPTTTVVERSPTSTSGRRLPTFPAEQSITAPHNDVPCSAVILPESIAYQDEVVATNILSFVAVDDAIFPTFGEQAKITFNEQTSPGLDNDSPETAMHQAEVRRSGRVRRNSSSYTAESDDLTSPDPRSRRTSRRSTRSVSVITNRPSDSGLKELDRGTRPSRIPFSLRPQVVADSRRRGGSRKYLQGTESFWNEMFWQARNQCDGYVTGRHTAGIATHPGARALYANRPPNIDEVILQAIEAGLPLPVDPQDLTAAWRDRMASVLKRSQSGVYISPTGVRRVDSSQYADHSNKPLCQILVLKSGRLKEVNFSEEKRHSSPSHPTASKPQLGFVSSRPTSVTGFFGPSPPQTSAEKNLSFMVSIPKLNFIHGPPLGVFHYDENIIKEAPISTISSEEDRSTLSRKPRTSKAVISTSPADSISRATTISLESPLMTGEQRAHLETASWRALPPPLTTRSRKRKLSGHGQAPERLLKRQKTVVLPKTDSLVISAPHTALAEATALTSNDAMEFDKTTIAPAAYLLKNLQPPGVLTPVRKKPREDRKEILKQILLEVVEDCGGIVPNEYLCISDYTNQKWHAKGRSGQADRKLCKDVIKSLCTSGKLKKLTFTFQRRSGVTAIGSLLAKADADAVSEAVMRLQRNIINALPDLYVPPLGSVLDAPSIEAPPPNRPPAKSPAKNRSPSAGKTMLRIPIRRFRMKNGARKDSIGVSKARKPFTWLGPPNYTPIKGSEDALALAFTYVGANQSETGHARWVDAESGRIEEERSTVKRKTTISTARRKMTRQLPDSEKTDLTSSPNRPGKLNWRTQRPITPLTFDPEAYAVSTIEDKTSTGMPKFGRSSRGRKIIWKTRDSDVLPQTLPSSLQDILDMPGQIPTMDYSTTEDPAANFFYWELDAVEYWEMNILKIYQLQASGWTFISHGTTERDDSSLDTNTHLKWEDPNILTTATFVPQPTYIKRGQPVRKPNPQKPLKVAIEHINDESVDSDYDPTAEGPAQTPTRRGRRLSSLQSIRRSKEQGTKRNLTRQKQRVFQGDRKPIERQGRPRILQTMAPEEIYRIVIAIIVVRTLAGGIGGEIDWPIVQRLCPNRDEAFLADRWSTLIIRNRQDITNLTESMQKKYIVAYERREVPSINFDDLQHSDWEGIVSWAEQNLNKNISDSVDELPSTRFQLLRTTVFTFDEPQTLRDSLANTGQQLRALKEEIVAKIPAAIPMLKSSSDAIDLRIEAEVEEENCQLSLAKSWALSTVMTPEESLNPTSITEKLSSIAPNKQEADQLFDQALKVLQRNLVIKRPKNQPRSAWRASERWFEMFHTKRMITAKMLKMAAVWKKDVFDLATEGGQGVEIEKTQIIQDGEMIAIINMVANGRCKITAGPGGLPRGRYGLDPDATSYNTKGMSRLLTLFATTVRPTHEYVFGDPLANRRLDIPGWQDDGRGKIPCWIDVNGAVLKENWEMVICAVVGLLSGRPGIQVLEIERTLGHGVTGWEVEIVLSWLEGSGFAQKTDHGKGWETKEWWWMVCGFTT